MTTIYNNEQNKIFIKKTYHIYQTWSTAPVLNFCYKTPKFDLHKVINCCKNRAKCNLGTAQMQKTLKNPVTFNGVGLHSGVDVVLTINPATENHGIIFKRVDIDPQPEIPALYSNVVDTRNCTCLGDKQGNLVSTIEHIMAALSVAGIDNALIEVNNQEIPIMDSSAQEFYQKLVEADKVEQKAPKKILKVLKEVVFEDEKGNKVSLKPSDKGQFINFEIIFPSQIVGHQKFEGEITPQRFEKEIYQCRTFAEKNQIDYLRSIGLIKGGSLENAVVLDGESILNPEGFRVKNECVNHKVLDAIGDLYSSGYYIMGEFNGYKSGHYHSNQLLKKLFSDESNYTII